MTWDSSDRLSRLPDDWDQIREEVFRTKGRKCLIRWGDGCEDDATDVDHIVRGDDHSITNLRPACPWCHSRKSSAEGNSVRKMMRVKSKRTPERHPGYHR